MIGFSSSMEIILIGVIILFGLLHWKKVM